MKINAYMLHDQLSFSFRKRDIQGYDDKITICQMVSHLYHYNCVAYTPEVEELDSILEQHKAATVHMTIRFDADDEPQLIVF